MPIPDQIKQHKPDTAKYGATEIRCLNQHYYVYQISSRWDKKEKRAKKVSGKCIGKITPQDGFIPNARCLLECHTAPAIVRTYGVFEMFNQLGSVISDRLRKIFPSNYRELKTVALLRLVDNCPPKLMSQSFSHSTLADLYPDLATSDKTMRKLMMELGARYQGEMEQFMRLFATDASTIMLDGTSIFTQNLDSYAQRGYTPQHTGQRQVRLLYLFALNSHAPVFYRMIPGNVTDKSAMVETIISSGVKDCVIIGDKGFYSKKNLAFLMENHFRFILPLQRNTRLITPTFEDASDQDRWDCNFVYHRRLIWSHKEPVGRNGNFLYVFRDDSKKSFEELKLAERIENDEGEEPLDMFADKRKGMFAFISNLDQTPKQIYLAYKERWDIEQCFDYLKNTVEIGASYQHNNASLLGWSFINHISLLYFYSLVQAMREADLTGDWTPKDIIMMAKNVYKVYDNGIEHPELARVSEIPNRSQELFEALGVKL